MTQNSLIVSTLLMGLVELLLIGHFIQTKNYGYAAASFVWFIAMMTIQIISAITLKG